MSSPRDAATPYPQVSSLGHRYLYKLVASAAALAAGLGMEVLLPRALGPVEYGRYNYSIQFFTQLLVIISGASTGFAARVARRPKGGGLIRAYFRWLLVMLALMSVFAALIFLLGANTALWPTLSITYVELGCLAAYFTFLGREITGIGDALGRTVRFETIRVVQRVLSLLLLLVLFVAEFLNAFTAFVFVAVTNLALVVALLSEAVLRRNLVAAFRRFGDRAAKPAFLYLVEVAMPTTALAVVSGATVILDRWVLQMASGDTQQGYFSLANQMIQAVTIFAASVVPLLVREMSIFHGRGDEQALRKLYTRLLPTLAFAVALPSCFLARESDLVGLIAGGTPFIGSAGAITAMALVPIYAAYGYVSTTVYFATNQLRLYRNIGLAVYSLSPVLTWIFVGPTAWRGLEMGATGLAVKTLLLAVILHNVLMFFNCRQLGLSYGKILLQQICLLTVLGLSTSVAHLAGAYLIEPRGSVMLAMLAFVFNFVLYILLTLLVIRVVPMLPGLEWREFADFYHRFARKRS